MSDQSEQQPIPEPSIKKRVKLRRRKDGYLAISLMDDNGVWLDYNLSEFQIEGEDK